MPVAERVMRDQNRPPIHPGEIFLSGCFANCSGMEVGRAAKRGDRIRLEIEGLGVLENRIV